MRLGVLVFGLGLCTTAGACSSDAPSGSDAGGGTAGASGGSAGDGGSTPSAGSGGSIESGAGGARPSGGTAPGGSSNAGAGASSGTPGGAQAGSDAGGAAGGGAGGGTGNSGGAASGSGGAISTGGDGGTSGATGCDWTNSAGRVVLFDGSSLASWRNARTDGTAQWRLVGDGTMEVVPLEPPTDLVSAMAFEDLCVHLEYMTPSYPANVTGQARGNSGIYLKRAYEMQILDSAGTPTTVDSCGAIYGMAAPLEVACNRELVWNTYEIEFKSSVWNSVGTKTEHAMVVSATLNGRLVQSRVALNPPGGATTAGEPDSPGPKPIMLQDHRNLVRFRNIWVKVPR